MMMARAVGSAETRNAQEDIEARLESGVALEVDTERGIDRGDLTLDVAQSGRQLALCSKAEPAGVCEPGSGRRHDP